MRRAPLVSGRMSTYRFVHTFHLVVLDPQYLDFVRGVLQHHVLLVQLVVLLLELRVDRFDPIARHLFVIFMWCSWCS